ncbi:uncharacterized protein [Henckelia pumila]|uniref:uncharacterized protein n=1 Tax=Henckelia pumila TaxID=405737 RepID=UPI003C6E733B
MLGSPISEKEVYESVWSLNEDSAVGPDGFSAGFFRRCWDIIKEDLLDAVRNFWSGSSLPRSVTATTIILIPKNEDAQMWSEFRPISLCNVLNKIITKLITIWLSRILPQIISPSQSGFVVGKLISDNVLLAQEMVNHLNYLIRGGNVIMKLDMAKAYDRVQWGFLLQMLRAFGFTEVFCQKILRIRKGDITLLLGLEKVLQPPGTVLHRFEMLCAKFLWGSATGGHSTHWISWEKICLPISEGGLGIRRLKDMVTSFSIKLWVRFRTVESLWSRFLLLKYCRTALPAEVQPVQNMSITWRRKLKVRSRAEPEIGWCICDGNISFWFDSWFSEGPLSSLVPIQGQSSRLVNWILTDRSWNFNRLLLVVPQDVAVRIMGVQIHSFSKDVAIWKLSNKGRFFVKYAWELDLGMVLPVRLWPWVAGAGRQWAVDRGFGNKGMITNTWVFAPNRLIHEFLISLGRAGVLKATHWRGCEDVATSLGMDCRIKKIAQVRVIRWLRPSVGQYFKLNSDGFYRGGGESGIGGIIKDYLGFPILAYHDSIGLATNTKVELCAILKGLQPCVQLNLFSLWLEVDSMVGSFLYSNSNSKDHFLFYSQDVACI